MVGVFFIISLMIALQAKNQNKILQQKRTIAENELKHQRDLARILIVSQEDERRRISMDLHDEVGTALSVLRMHFEKIAGISKPEDLALLHATGKRSIDNIIYSLRKISHDLSPFTKGVYELRKSIEDLIDRVIASNKLIVSVDLNGIEEFSFLPNDTQLALYRILCELINNTIKHAATTSAHLSFVKSGPLLSIYYSDHGIGIMNAKDMGRGIGMANIESRCNAAGATYTLEENKGKGFGIKIKIPIT